MSDLTLPSFRYRLEQQPPHTDCGGVVRGANRCSSTRLLPTTSPSSMLRRKMGKAKPFAFSTIQRIIHACVKPPAR
jgi:hypothetical protein